VENAENITVNGVPVSDGQWQTSVSGGKSLTLTMTEEPLRIEGVDPEGKRVSTTIEPENPGPSGWWGGLFALPVSLVWYLKRRV
jgi:hypothetical protein